MKNILILAALAAASFSAPAAAGPEQVRRDVRVNVADLDLRTADGVAELDRRLARAVAQACGTAHHLEPEQQVDKERCQTAARARAMAARDAIMHRPSGGASHLRSHD